MTSDHSQDPHAQLAAAAACAGRALGRLEVVIEARQAYTATEGDCPSEVTGRVLDAALRARHAIARLEREIAAVLD